MASSNLRKIILEELKKVLKEDWNDMGNELSATHDDLNATTQTMAPLKQVTKKSGNPKVKKLQQMLHNMGLDVGKIDGIVGPKLYSAISKVAEVSPEQVAKDFRGPGAAKNYLTIVGSIASDPNNVSNLAGSKISNSYSPKGPGIFKKEDDVSATPVDTGSSMTAKSPTTATQTKPVSPPAPQSTQEGDLLPTQQIKPSTPEEIAKRKAAQKKVDENPLVKTIKTALPPKEKNESLRRDLARMLKNL